MYAIIGIGIGIIVQVISRKIYLWHKRKNLKYDAENKCWHEYKEVDNE